MKHFLLLLLVLTVGAADPVQDHLQKGLFEEEVNRDFDQAIVSFRAVVQGYSQQRHAAATALFHLADCLRKQGKTTEAEKEYRRLLSEFPDEKELVQKARTYVKDTAGTAVASALDSAASGAEQNEIQKIRFMLKNSPDLLNSPEYASPGNTAIHQAIVLDQPAVVKFLLDNHADIESKVQWAEAPGATPLIAACFYGRKAIVEILIDHGAKIDAATKFGDTPLHIAASHGFFQICQYLLEKGAALEAVGRAGTPLVSALAANQDKIAIFFLEKGANPNPRKGSPLHVAVQLGDLRLVELLLSKKANPNTVESISHNNRQYYGTPLSRAILDHNIPLIELLLKNGANPNAEVEAGRTAFNIAIDSSHLEVCEMLVKAGANVNDLIPGTILSNWKTMAPWFLDHGLDPNRIVDGFPLWHSLFEYSQSAELAETVLSRVQNINFRRSDGETMTDRAFNNGLANRELLRRHGGKKSAELDRPELIQLRSTRFVSVLFRQSQSFTNELNLFDALIPSGVFSHTFQWPSLRTISIHRLNPGGTEMILPVNAALLADKSDCENVPALQWGDIIEIPEEPHGITDVYQGVAALWVGSKVGEGLTNCLQRRVEIRVKGKSEEVKFNNPLINGFGIIGVITKYALTTSDLSKIKVIRKRQDGSHTEIVLDLRAEFNPPLGTRGQETTQVSTGGGSRAIPTRPARLGQPGIPVPTPAPPGIHVLQSTQGIQPTEFWLRNGDVIEIPEKQ